MCDREPLRRHRGLLELTANVNSTVHVGAALVLLLAASAARADDVLPIEPVTVLVSDFEVNGTRIIDDDTAREIVASRLRRLAGKIHVRSLGEVQSSLDKAALAQMLGAESTGDLESIARYIEVDRIVSGRVVDVAGVTDVSIRLFHVSEGVMELSLSRRVKAGADPSLVLTVLEALADHLLAYMISAYTDGAPSKAFENLKAKKIALRPPAKANTPVVDAAPRSKRGIGTPIGAFFVGAGAGGLALGGLLVPVDEDATFGTNLGLVGQVAIPAAVLLGGAIMLATGATMLVLDGLE